MDPILRQTDHRPYPLPNRPWRLSQRWNDLLFAHWPVSAAQIIPVLPRGIEVETFDGHAWVGVVPFWMDQVRARAIGQASLTVPGAASFSELNLRTYVRSSVTGRQGVYFFSLDAASLLAVLGARTLFHLPYFWSRISRSRAADGSVGYTSRRILPGRGARLAARYRSLGPPSPPSQPGSLAYFLTERYCLFTAHRSRILVGEIHHLPWPLEPAAADISQNQIPSAHQILLPDQAPVLHFSKALRVYLWSLTPDL